MSCSQASHPGRFTDSAVPFDLPVHGFPVKTEADAEDVAETLRDRWKLGVDSIGDLTAVFEDHLVHVLEMEGPEKFDGISICRCLSCAKSLHRAGDQDEAHHAPSWRAPDLEAQIWHERSGSPSQAL